MCALRRLCHFYEVMRLWRVVSALPRLCACGGCRVHTLHRGFAAVTSYRDITHAQRALLIFQDTTFVRT